MMISKNIQKGEFDEFSKIFQNFEILSEFFI